MLEVWIWMDGWMDGVGRWGSERVALRMERGEERRVGGCVAGFAVLVVEGKGVEAMGWEVGACVVAWWVAGRRGGERERERDRERLTGIARAAAAAAAAAASEDERGRGRREGGAY